MRILIVDDDAVVLRTHMRALIRYGFLVDTATGVRDAYELALQYNNTGKPFDAVVSDIDMRDGTGFDLADQLRQDILNVPRLILMTGNVTPWKTEEASRVGGELYLKTDLDIVIQSLSEPTLARVC